MGPSVATLTPVGAEGFTLVYVWEHPSDGEQRGDDTTTLTMRNVVPESALAMAPPDGPPVTAGPYDVMVARWGQGA